MIHISMSEKWKKHNTHKGKFSLRDAKTGEIIGEGNMNEIFAKPEDNPDNSHRERLDRKKQGLVHKQIYDDMQKIMKQVSYIDETNFPKGKYQTWTKTIEPNPKTLQRKGGQSNIRKKYREILEEYFKKEKDELGKFKDKKLLVYLCFYLRKDRFEKSDVDNYIKWFIDSFKEYIGDDKQIATLIAEKKQLDDNYEEADLDFLETTLVYITEHRARSDLLKF